MQILPGESLGPYEIISPIGESGMGEVWKARDTRLDRIITIKFSIVRPRHECRGGMLKACAPSSG
jgi:hypothetical protein